MSFRRGAVSPATAWSKRRSKLVAPAGSFAMVRRQRIAPTIVRSGRASGSIRISIATCVATIAVCAPRRERHGASWARAGPANCQRGSRLGVSEIFVTGGEPFLLADIGAILDACTAAAPTTLLTNGMLFAGRRLETLRLLSRERLTLQISLDSPTPERHDAHRGKGSWARALKGIECARAEGFRVRMAATVASDDEGEEFRRFLDARQIGEADRVIRRVALRGSATQGVALARADLLPEITITAEGVYWHPVGAEDADLLVTTEIFPLAESFSAVRRAFERESEHRRRLAMIFNCA